MTRDDLTAAIKKLVDESGLHDSLTIVLSERRDGNVYAKGIGGAGIQWKLSYSEPGLLLPKGEVEMERL